MQRCEFHPERIAVGRCRRCGGHFCVRCAEETGQTSFCKRCAEESRSTAEAAAAGGRAGAGEEAAGEAFLARGPDYDFSELKREPRLSVPAPGGAAGKAVTVSGLGEGGRSAAPGVEEQPPAEPDQVLDEVLASLAATAAPEAVEARPRGESPAAEAGEIPLQQTARERLAELAEQRRREKERRRKERAERWSFLAQPRAEEPTFIATTKTRAVLVVLGFWLMAVLLWAVPNAFLPFWPFARDNESLLWAQVVGIAVGLCLWRKAGRAHGTKLAVQAALITLFGIIAGEFVHWFLMVYKEEAFRTIISQLLTFRFIQEQGAEILGHVTDAIFSRGFVLMVALPTILAFIIGFGMPPIPEFLFELWGAATGRGSRAPASGAGDRMSGRPGVEG